MTNTDTDPAANFPIATRSNMEQFPGCTAYSFDTQEEYAANAADYFLMRTTDVLRDDNGEPMVLVKFRTVIINPMD